MRQHFFLDTKDRLLQELFIIGGFNILGPQILDGAGEKDSGPASWRIFSSSLGSTISTMNWVTALGV
jgi:hypothetical protein